MNGIVYLVGAGPGDPKLLTLRGKECLERADVVFYDALANASLLGLAPNAEKVYVGKCAGRHAVPQEDLQARLIEAARAGHVVVRLKGGDPFVFGRGGEEAEALVDAGIRFEVVPGVTSPIAAAAYAGIPLTHRQYASSVAFVTGHEDPTKTERAVDWRALATDVDTIAILMGTRRLPEIVAELIAGGRSEDTPVAAIQWGTHPKQRTIVSDLRSIVEVMKRNGVGSPAIVVVGDVVRLRDKLRWFDTKPLFGRLIVVTRAREQASRLVALLAEAGADVIECPTIRTEPPEDVRPLDEALDRLAGFDWVLFTSANSVRYVWERLAESGRDARAFGNSRIGAIGPATAAALRERGITPDLVPSDSRSEGVVAEIGNVAGRRVLIPHADRAREALRAGLKRAGAEIVAVTAYRTLPDADDVGLVRDLLLQGNVDAITFTSGSTVENFVDALHGEEIMHALDGTCVAVIGPVTAEAARSHGLYVTTQADSASVDALVEAVIAHFTG